MANELTKSDKVKRASPESDKAWKDSWFATLNTLEAQLKATPEEFNEEVEFAALTSLFVYLTERGFSREYIVTYLLTGPR